MLCQAPPPGHPHEPIPWPATRQRPLPATVQRSSSPPPRTGERARIEMHANMQWDLHFLLLRLRPRPGPSHQRLEHATGCVQLEAIIADAVGKGKQSTGRRR